MEAGWSEAYIEGIGYGRPKHPPDVIRKWLERLGSPERAFRYVHTAGTNGKGSVCACLSSAFRKAGFETGLFTSPHLVTVRERLAFNGNIISRNELDEVCETVLKALDLKGFRAASGTDAREGEDVYGPEHPTYFEFLFLLAMVYFARKKADLAVIEAGIGGTHDVTNVPDSKILTVITPIGLDHMGELGGTSAEIAAHKAGIMRPGVPCVYAAGDADADRVIAERAAAIGAPLTVMRPEQVNPEAWHDGVIDFSYRFRYDGRGHFAVPGNAPYQARNAALAAEAFMTLKRTGGHPWDSMSPEALSEGLRGAYWPGRMEEILPDVFLDGAHNGHGVWAFLEAVRFISEMSPRKDSPEGGDRRVLLFSAKERKDYREMIRLLAEERWDMVFLSELREDGAESGELLTRFRENGQTEVRVMPDTGSALKAALAARGRGRVFICGSLYLTGEIEEILND